MKTKHYFFRAASLAAAGMLSGHAISTEVLPSVTVVGAKEGSATQKSIIEAGKEVREIPGGASIVDMQTVKQGRVSTWVDSLGLAPGVFVQIRRAHL